MQKLSKRTDGLTEASFASEYHTEIGRGLVMSTALGICRLVMPGETSGEGLAGGQGRLMANGWTVEAARRLEAYFRREQVSFLDLPVDLTAMSSFRAMVLSVTRMIPYGSTVSYAEIATRVGCPRGSRAVGGALAANPIPLMIPCHRVIAAHGGLGGFSASGGLDMKRYLLGLEHTEIEGKFF